jgi:alpha-amylase/alpha-mannosidase (GH57 family)
MHQPYYRASRTAPFDMPWARMHALKDYLDMVEILGGYPALHQTFNLVPSLVEQLETYAAGDFADVYWAHTMRPARDLEPAERAFIVERMCEHSDHPRARSHPRYLELAVKREANACSGWAECGSAFTLDEIRDLQVWFNLAWFEPQTLERPPLADLVNRGSHFAEDDKAALASVQADLLTRTLPTYREAAARGQIEISTSPYFHPILPLLINSDSARIASADLLLPRKRFAHLEDAREQVEMAVAKHQAVFGQRPRGIWCSEQAVGEDVIPLLLRADFEWTISDESVLARSLSGISHPRQPGPPGAAGGAAGFPSQGTHGQGGAITPRDLYTAYRLERDDGAMGIVFRDHTLSDLIGFAYSSWGSRDAAANLIARLRDIRTTLASKASPGGGTPLVTIALDGENAWEYYPRDGRDFLQYLYEGLSADAGFRCLTVAEHLLESPATRPLDWLHTGSWIGADLRTWIGDSAHATGWELLHAARDAVSLAAGTPPPEGRPASAAPSTIEEAWHHILVAEGSDWFWWFGEHHHTTLDAVWDLNFRRHLEEAYRILGLNVPVDLFFPVIPEGSVRMPTDPKGPVFPTVDGMLGAGGGSLKAEESGEWTDSGSLVPALPSTMQRAESVVIREVRFGWNGPHLYLLIVPDPLSPLLGLEIEARLVRPLTDDDLTFYAVLEDGGLVRAECKLSPQAALESVGAWKEVVEFSFSLPGIDSSAAAGAIGLVVRVGRDGMADHVFHSARLGSQGLVTT